MEGSKLQLDTWEAIWYVVYALPAIVDTPNFSTLQVHSP